MVHKFITMSNNNDYGIFEGVEAEDYFEWQGCSQSLLKVFEKSPRHALFYSQKEEEEDLPSEALVLGSAFHMMILEPAKFERTYTIFEGARRSGKEWEELSSMWAVDKILKRSQLELLQAWKKEVYAHPEAKKILDALLNGTPQTELSIRWKDDEGPICKARIDGYLEKNECVVELKTTLNASPDGFSREILTHRYHRQGALDLRGLRKLGKSVKYFIIIAVEKSAPYNVAVYRLCEKSLDKGDRECAALLKHYHYCSENQRWPGYGDTMQDISIPDYALT